MMTLKITAARAAELTALDKAGSHGWFVRVGESNGGTLRAERFADGRRSAVAALDFDPGDAALAVEARNALRDWLTDRAMLLDALRRSAGTLNALNAGHIMPGSASATATLADLRALLASAGGSAEGGSDG